MISAAMGTEKRTRQKANRAAKSAERAKAAQRARLRRTVIRAAVIGLIVVAVVLTFQFGRDGATTTDPSTTSTTVGADTTPPAWAAVVA